MVLEKDRTPRVPIHPLGQVTVIPGVAWSLFTRLKMSLQAAGDYPYPLGYGRGICTVNTVSHSPAYYCLSWTPTEGRGLEPSELQKQCRPHRGAITA